MVIFWLKFHQSIPFTLVSVQYAPFFFQFYSKKMESKNHTTIYSNNVFGSRPDSGASKSAIGQTQLFSYGNVTHFPLRLRAPQLCFAFPQHY